jgi:tripartite-type tricarboxylate transporter receptor subunit TctC
VHVPYKGITPALMDTVGGQVQMVISVIPAVLPTVKAGRVRALGVTSAKRTPLALDLPTIAETVPGYEFIGWYSLVAPAKTPPTILAKVNAEVVKALSTAELPERLSNLGADSIGSTRKELAAYLPEELEKMRKAVKDSGARPD